MKNSSRPIETQWIAITGVPSSGKTSLIDILRNKYQMRTSPDFPRKVLEEARKEGHTTNDFANNPSYYQNIIAKTYLESVDKMPPYVQIFHDYGLPCIKAWGESCGVAALPELAKACRLYQYAHVFLLEPLDIVADGIRIGDNELHKKFLNNIKENYKMLGIKPVIVPRFSDNKNRSNILRAEFIINYLANHKPSKAMVESAPETMPEPQEA